MTRGQVRNNTKFPRIFPLHYRRFSVSKESEKLQPDFILSGSILSSIILTKKIDNIKLEFLTTSIKLQKKIYTYMSASFGNRHLLLIFVSYFLGFQLMYSGAALRESTAAHPEHAKRSLLLCCAAGIFLKIAWRNIVL